MEASRYARRSLASNHVKEAAPAGAHRVGRTSSESEYPKSHRQDETHRDRDHDSDQGSPCAGHPQPSRASVGFLLERRPPPPERDVKRDEEASHGEQVVP